MNYSHNQERMAIEDFHDIELQNITGGCADCLTDGRIVNATKRVENAGQTPLSRTLFKNAEKRATVRRVDGITGML